MPTRRLVFPLLAAAALAGCAGPYVPPTSGPTATLRIHNTSSLIVETTSYAVADDCSGDRSRLPPGILRPNGGLVVTIPAGRPFSFAVSYTKLNEAGHLPMTFTPAPGGVYDAWFQAADGRFGASMNAMRDATSMPEPTFRMRIWRDTMIPTGAGCW